MSTAITVRANPRQKKAPAIRRGIILWTSDNQADIATARTFQWETGAPTHSAPQGSLYYRVDAPDSDTTWYRATDAVGTWEAIVGSEVTELLAANNAWSGNETHSGTETFSNAAGVTTDTVTERSAGVGVTVDGALIKDSHIVDSVGFYDAAAPTKVVRLDAGAVSAGQTRVLTMPDQDVTITAAGAALLDDATAAAQATTLGLGTGDSPTWTGGTFTGNVKIQGKIVATGSPVLIDAEHVDMRANYSLLNTDYTTAAGVTAGFVANYLPTATVDTCNGAVVAGVDGVSDPTIATTGAATFAITDIVMISGSENDGENDGLYEVQAHAGNVLTLKSTSNGISNRVEDFTLDQLVANAGETFAITKVTVSVARVGTDGIWEVGSGSQTGIAYSNLVRASDIGSTVQAYDAGLVSLAALATAADRMPYTTAADTYAETVLTTAGRALLDDASAAAQATTLGLGTGDTPTFTNAVLTANQSTPSGAGVASVENPGTRKVTITLTNAAVVLADNAGVTAYGSLKVLDLPAGLILFHGAVMDLAVTLSAAGVNADWDGDVGLGTVAADNGATPLAGTEQDFVPNTATPQAVAGVTTADAKSTATEVGDLFDGTGTAIDVYLNFLVDDADHDVTTTPTNLVINGTITFTYTNLGDN